MGIIEIHPFDLSVQVLWLYWGKLHTINSMLGCLEVELEYAVFIHRNVYIVDRFYCINDKAYFLCLYMSHII